MTFHEKYKTDPVYRQKVLDRCHKAHQEKKKYPEYVKLLKIKTKISRFNQSIIYHIEMIEQYKIRLHHAHIALAKIEEIWKHIKEMRKQERENRVARKNYRCS